MRAELRVAQITVTPGGTAVFDIDVYNDADVIEGVGVQVIGVDPAWVTTTPDQLALFPDAPGTIRVAVVMPPELIAGSRELTFVCTSRVDPGADRHLTGVVEIAPATDATLTVEPTGVAGRREAESTVVIENRGNHPLDVTVSAEDDERLLTFVLDPPVLVVPPGERVATELRIRGPRRWIGSPVMRPFVVRGATAGRELTGPGNFTQHAVLPRGVATVAILLGILALWALAANLAIGLALNEDDLAKAAPASFFAPGAGIDGAAAATKGLDVRSVGGDLPGRVLAATDGRGIPRVTVEAVRDTRLGPVLASASATGDDGDFTISGLLPGSYLLRFTAPGYDEQWFPGVPSQAQAEPVRVSSQDDPVPVSIDLEGRPGSLSGRVDVGASSTPVAVAITLRPMVGGVRGDPLPVGSTDADGAYQVGSLPTPATYELTFDAPGFQPQSVVQDLEGGQAATVNTVRLGSGTGSIQGVVGDGTQALGGVTVTATSGGETYATATPTAGVVGVFLLSDLPTPATYLLTFERQGFSSETVAVDLGPGEHLTDLRIDLSGGTGTIAGRVTGPDGAGMGDAIVTVSGEETVVETATLTSGDVGTWRVSGLPTPGRYTVTVSHDGFVSETRAVELGPSGSASGIDMSLQRSDGAIAGTVRRPNGSGLGGVEIEVTDGSVVRLGHSADTPPGAFHLGSLPPGDYSVTFRIDGFQPQTVLVQLRSGQTATLDVTLTGPGP